MTKAKVNKKPWLFPSIMALLIAISTGVVVLTPGDKALYCDVNGVAGVFKGGTSKDNYTAYPFKENRTMAEKCLNIDTKIKGKWSPINVTTECTTNKWEVDAEGRRCRQ